jgi:transposase InsO family protein
VHRRSQRLRADSSQPGRTSRASHVPPLERLHQRLLRKRSIDGLRSIAFGTRCKEMNVRPCMGTVVDAYDNAMAESFFASLQCELIDRHCWQTLTPARLERLRLD